MFFNTKMLAGDGVVVTELPEATYDSFRVIVPIDGREVTLDYTRRVSEVWRPEVQVVASIGDGRFVVHRGEVTQEIETFWASAVGVKHASKLQRRNLVLETANKAIERVTS